MAWGETYSVMGKSQKCDENEQLVLQRQLLIGKSLVVYSLEGHVYLIEVRFDDAAN